MCLEDSAPLSPISYPSGLLELRESFAGRQRFVEDLSRSSVLADRFARGR